ncbi:uncharacterized protein LOC122359421 [Puntigrus tetrazona]|uniref:uncharacterized protein LOC122359421 n=1 Tax=Puntigrus tetrazona TaxID=1606681 RepID=UPI001C89F0A0|nr:uncharacterized protein LOC122359421 [Puntigrus tetrazona]
MASTPSASALSAVLRCQGKILARKQANKKRPPAAVYGLGVTCGDSVKSYFRSLWGFIFDRERAEIPGVLSVAVRFEKSGKSSVANDRCKNVAKSPPKTGRQILTRKASSEPNQWPKTRLASEYASAFKSQRYRVSVKNDLVLRLDGTFLRKLKSDYPWTCICVVCKSTLNYSNVDPFSFGLLCILRNKLIYFTTAVSDGLQKQLGIGWNQLHPDCDKLSGCARRTSEHHEDRPKKLEGAEPGE